MLTALILLPALGRVLVALVAESSQGALTPARGGAVACPLALAGFVFSSFVPGEAGFQMVEQAVWYEPWGVSWYLGIDGISLPARVA